MSIKNLSFFYDNYDKYDLATQTRYKDFGGLEDAQVVCVGEAHHTSVLCQLQYETLPRLAGSVNACALLEGLNPGQVLKKHPEWEGLPANISLLGSDVRIPSSSEEYTQWLKLIEKAKRLVLEKIEHHTSRVRQQAALLNEALKKNEMIIDEEKNAVKVTPALAQQIEALKPQRNPEYSAVKKQLGKRTKQALALRDSTASGGEITRSNEGMFEEIQKALHQYRRVIPIWGLNHFLLGDELFAKLDKAHIKYIVLLPNKKNLKKAEEESSWRRDTFEKISLKINQNLKLKIPAQFRKFFHPSIPFSRTRKIKPQVFDSLKFLERQDLQWAWPVNTPLHFKNLSTNDLIVLDDNFGEGSRFRKKGTPPSLDSVIDCIHNMLFLGNRYIQHFDIPDSSLDIYLVPPLYKKEFLVIKAKQPVTFNTAPQGSIGTATYLFQEMRRLKRAFEMKAGSWALFLDISENEIHKLLKKPHRFNAWLKSRAPKDMRVVCEGSAVIALMTYTGVNYETLGLRVSTEQSYKISLQPRHKARIQ